MYLGGLIRELRIKKGMTQYELAERAGISRSYLTHIENESKKGTIAVLKRITEALEMEFVMDMSYKDKKIVS